MPDTGDVRGLRLSGEPAPTVEELYSGRRLDLLWDDPPGLWGQLTGGVSLWFCQAARASFSTGLCW